MSDPSLSAAAAATVDDDPFTVSTRPSLTSVGSRPSVGSASFAEALNAMHKGPPYQFLLIRPLFEAVLADPEATDVQRARANLSLFIIYNWNWGVSFDNASRDTHKAAAASSISLLLRERDFSDPIRAFEMGYCHYAGVGTERDFGKAYALFQQSSTGCMAGTVAVGWCLAYGDGIACDKTSAAHYFELAASKWHPEGMLMYGKCLCQGEGVPRDEKKGLALIQHAAELENWWAKEWLEKSSYVDPPPEPTVAPAAATTARAASATPSAEGASQRERRCAVM